MQLPQRQALAGPGVAAFALFTAVAAAYATQWWLADPGGGSWADRFRAALLDWWIWSALAAAVFAGARRATATELRRWLPAYAAALALLVVGQVALLAVAEQAWGIAAEDALADTFRRLLRKKIAINLLIATGLLAIGHLRASASRHGHRDDTRPPAGPSAAFAVRSGQDVVLVRAADVCWAEAAGNYVVLHTPDAHEVVRLPLHAVLERIGTDAIRVNRSTLVRLDQVAAIEGRTRQGDATLVLRCGARVRLSRTCRRALLERLPPAT